MAEGELETRLSNPNDLVQKLWIYDLRTNPHLTLKESTLRHTNLDDFVTSYQPKEAQGTSTRDR